MSAVNVYVVGASKETKEYIKSFEREDTLEFLFPDPMLDSRSAPPLELMLGKTGFYLRDTEYILVLEERDQLLTGIIAGIALKIPSPYDKCVVLVSKKSLFGCYHQRFGHIRAAIRYFFESINRTDLYED